MSNYWRIELQGHQFDIDEVKALLTPEAFIVEERDDQWCISGPAFDDCESAAEALAAALDIIDVTNGVISLARSDFKPVKVGSTCIRGDNVNESILIGATEMRFKSNAVVVNASDSEQPQHPAYERERRWLRASKLDPTINEVFNLCSSDKDDKHFRLYERISKSTHGSSIQELTGWSNSRCKKIKGALSKPRHEIPNYSPKMSLQEAKRHADELTKLWLDWKADKLL